MVQEAKKIEQKATAAPELKTPAKPFTSDPAAQKLLAEVLAAHTGGKPELLAKLKQCRFTRTGQIEQPNGRFPNIWTTTLAWPDRYRLATEQIGVATNSMTYASSPNGAWMYPAGPDNKDKATMPPEFLLTFLLQNQEDAVSLLFALTEPGIVVQGGTPDTLDGQPVLKLEVWNAALPYARIDVDAATKLVKRITYNGREMTSPIVKELLLLNSADYSGIKLASRILVKGGGRTLAEWNEFTVEFLPVVDPKLFEQP